jgi:hypothetical protein
VNKIQKKTKAGDIKAKFCYVTKRETRNMVIEVDRSTRGKLDNQDKARMGNLPNR